MKSIQIQIDDEAYKEAIELRQFNAIYSFKYIFSEGLDRCKNLKYCDDLRIKRCNNYAEAWIQYKSTYQKNLSIWRIIPSLPENKIHQIENGVYKHFQKIYIYDIEDEKNGWLRIEYKFSPNEHHEKLLRKKVKNVDQGLVRLFRYKYKGDTDEQNK